MTKLFKITVGTAVVLLFGLMMSCNNLSENELGVGNESKGTVVFKITDAPFPVDLVKEANVTVDWIKLLKYPADNAEVEGEEAPEGEAVAEGEEVPEGDAEMEGEEVLDEEDVILIELEVPVTYNLLELRNGLTETMAAMEIPVGSYSEIRLHVTSAGIVLNDETSHSLKVPSGHASGIKIKLEPALDVAEGVETEVLVDFDLSRSFVMRGNKDNNNGFIFKPVVRAVANVQTTTGEIAGTVTDQNSNPIGGASLTLLLEDEDDLSAISMNENGYYSLIGVPPGTHTLVLEIGEYKKEVTVTVEIGVTTEENFVVETAI